MVEDRIEPSAGRRQTSFEAIATFALVAALLYFGAGIIVPLVLAILLAFALTPLVTWLNRRLRLPDAVAVIISVVGAVCLLMSIATLAGLQLARLAEDLPGYQQTVSAKLNGLQNHFGGELLDRINGTISSLSAQVSDVTQAEAPAEGRPVPVAITNNVGPLGLLSSVLGSIIGPVATLAIVVIFLIFLLLGRADMLERFIRLVGSGDYAKTNLAMADASRRVGRYLLVQLAVNCTYGLLFGLGLWLIGVPSALLWGVLIVVFRYIPFVGALIIATVPFALAFAVDPTWNMLLLTLGLFLVLDLTTANVVEPRLYGSSTGVSPIAILISAMFWATLWGPIGLILATPMTVCLVVIGRHIPELRFLDTLLGSEPVLTPPEQLYQRLLKGDPIAATEIFEEYTLDHSQFEFINDVAFPALVMASSELADRPAALEQRRQLIESFNMMLEEFEVPETSNGPVVLIVGGRTEIDEAAAKLMAMQLAESGVPTRVLPPMAIKPQAIERLTLDDVATLAMVFLGADVRSQARYVSRKLRRNHKKLELVVCAFGDPVEGETLERLHVDTIHRDHAEAARELHQRWEGDAAHASGPPNLDINSPHIQSRLLEIADEFKVSVARIDLISRQRHNADGPGLNLTQLACNRERPLLVTQDHNADLLAGDEFMQANGILLYAAAPLKLADGEPVGALILMDYKGVELTAQDLETLQGRSDDLMQLLLGAQPV